jgi:hypothetical protein
LKISIVLSRDAGEEGDPTKLGEVGGSERKMWIAGCMSPLLPLKEREKT